MLPETITRHVNTPCLQGESRRKFVSRSIPLLHRRPHLAQRLLEPPAIENVEMLERHGVRMINARHFPDLRELRFQILLLAVHHDDAFARIAARSPQKITLMAADGRRQTELRAEQID